MKIKTNSFLTDKQDNLNDIQEIFHRLFHDELNNERHEEQQNEYVQYHLIIIIVN